jgi:putative ABC transport system substrate-binding protein
LASLLSDLIPKRIELLKEIVPGLTRIGILQDPDNPTFVRTRKMIEATTHSLQIRSILLEVRTLDDLRPAFAAASSQGVGALTVVIAELALQHRLPAVYGSREFVDVGGLLSYGVNYPDLYRRAQRAQAPEFAGTWARAPARADHCRLQRHDLRSDAR